MKNKAEKDYFFVNRSLLYSDRWLSEPFTRGQAWIDLFGLAQHSKGHFRIRGIKIPIERGQLAYSQVTLSKRWKWSRNKVRRYLKELEKNNDITLKTKHQNMDITTIITLLKYNHWQGSVIENETPSETPEGHQKDTRRNTYNKVNKVNKKNLYSALPYFEDSDFQEVWIEFLEVRRKRKTTTSDRAMKKIVNDLLKFAQNKEEAIEIVANSATSGYPNLYPLKENSKNDFIVDPSKLAI